MDHIVMVKSLDLPAGEYLVIGASPMDIHGIRTSPDIDLLVSPRVFEILKAQGWEEDVGFKARWEREKLVRKPFEAYQDFNVPRLGGYVSVDKMLDRADFVDGVPLLSLEDLVVYKKDNGRPKDLEDIKLIEAYFTKQ